MAAGYSSNPLYKKLGLKEGMSVKLVNAPAHYTDLIGSDFYKTLHIQNKAIAGLDLIHLFTNKRDELEAMLPRLMEQIKKNGIIWGSWYKKSAGKPTELTENIIRDIALSAGLVDVKVCAVDEGWSGLKLVYRLKYR